MKKIYIFILVLVIFFVGIFSYQRNKEAKILFVGDMNFDRYIRQVGENKGEDFVFSCLSNFLKDSDVVVGNLEGPITDNPSVSLGSVIDTPQNYTFTFPPSIAKVLAENNIKIVNLGNNHISNFGQAGIASTKKYLKASGVNYLYDDVYRTKLAGQNISFISYNEFGGESAEKIAQKILTEKNNGQMVLLYTHWGDEYVEAPQRVKNIAKLFAKSGADLIVGSHPHVILPSEKITSSQPSPYPKERETVVYYSLGNFIFDQYWNKAVSTGLVLEVNIKAGTINIVEHKVSLNRDGRTCLIN
ncbi:MAG: CapA family protein [Candidatus Paceibacterota bacterium]|jgi:poly-gamma-glutamate synthesis protein (capsule biosynthesis protein)